MRKAQQVVQQSVILLRWAGPACAHALQSFVTASVAGKFDALKLHPLAHPPKFPGPACSVL